MTIGNATTGIDGQLQHVARLSRAVGYSISIMAAQYYFHRGLTALIITKVMQSKNDMVSDSTPS
jgi:hypothetical protein